MPVTMDIICCSLPSNAVTTSLLALHAPPPDAVRYGPGLEQFLVCPAREVANVHVPAPDEKLAVVMLMSEGSEWMTDCRQCS